MLCPHCGEDTPETSPTCAHCGMNLQVTAGSVFDPSLREDRGTDWGPKLLRYAVGLAVLAAVLGFGTSFLGERRLAKNRIPDAPLEVPQPTPPAPQPPEHLPQAPLIEPLAVQLPARLPLLKAAFGSRDSRVRQLFLERNGGDARTEAAVRRSLEWLGRIQADEGSWDYKKFDVDPKYQAAQHDFRLGVSGLALLAFLGAGHHHRQAGPFQETVDKALRYLLSQQQTDGKFPGRLYHQGICTMALTEAYGLSGDTSLLEPARKAIEAIVAAQTETGGWDYGHHSARDRSDTSVTGWQVMALKSARRVGIEFPDAVLDKAVGFLTQVANERGAIGYELPPGERPWRTTPALTAAGLNALLFAGVEAGDPRVHKAVSVLLAHLPQMPKPHGDGWRPRADIYFWYHGSLALSRLGGSEWALWNDRVKAILLELQDKEGELAGSWSPCGDPWSDRAGRIYFSALATMALEVYYRYD